MKFHPKAIIGVVKESFSEFTDDKAQRLGAALAYYTIFSIAPLLVITIAIVGVLFHREAAQGLVSDQLGHLIGKQGADAIQSMVKGAGDKKNTGIIASIVGFVILLVGASGVFVQLKDALNSIWDVPAKQQAGGIKGFVRTRFLSFGLVIAVGFLLLVSLIISTILSGVGKLLGGMAFLAPVLGAVNFAISFAVITALFALIFKYLPDIKITWKDVWFGAAVTSLLFTIGKSLIGLYLGKSSVTSAYGAAGSLVVLLIWVYYSAQILFFGAELTQVYTRHHGSLFAAGSESPRALQKSDQRQTANSVDDKELAIDDDKASNRAPSRKAKPGGLPAPVPAFASRPSRTVEVAAKGLTYGILGLLHLGTAKKAVGLAPAPQDPIHLGGRGKTTQTAECITGAQV